MFDLATRLQPATSSAAALAGVPFDLRLAPPAAPSPYPYTSLVNASATPTPGGEVLATYALALEGGLTTAVLLSLWTDRRAGLDDALPLRETDRRGWVGDEYMAGGADDPWGSGLWLLYTGKVTANVLELARFTALESLAWLLRDGIAGRVDVAAAWVQPAGATLYNRLAVRVTIWQPEQTRPVYDVLWGTSILSWASA